MSSIAISMIVFACLFASALLGMFLRSKLPQHHLNGDSKAVVQVGMGLVGTLAALVLGLLVSSAKSFYDTQTSDLTRLSANIVLLDRMLAEYGSDAGEVREILRSSVVHVLDQMWSKDALEPSLLEPMKLSGESLYEKVQQLSPTNDEQRQFKAEALSLASQVGQIRWLMYEQRAHSVSLPILAIVVFWLTALFISFGLFAPANATVVASLLVSALSVSGAVLLLLEMYSPYVGWIQISSAPLRAALVNLGQ